jgi:hypothetical protein
MFKQLFRQLQEKEEMLAKKMSSLKREQVQKKSFLSEKYV